MVNIPRTQLTFFFGRLTWTILWGQFLQTYGSRDFGVYEISIVISYPVILRILVFQIAPRLGSETTISHLDVHGS